MKTVRKRNIQVLIRLNAQEKEFLDQQVKKSGLPQETYIRALISGYVPKELPPMDYHSMIRELHAIGATTLKEYKKYIEKMPHSKEDSNR